MRIYEIYSREYVAVSAYINAAPVSGNPQLTDFEYATKIYGDQAANGSAEDEDDSDAGGDIEAEINKELADIRKPAVKPLFMSVKLDTQCCKEHNQIIHINY